MSVVILGFLFTFLGEGDVGVAAANGGWHGTEP